MPFLLKRIQPFFGACSPALQAISCRAAVIQLNWISFAGMFRDRNELVKSVTFKTSRSGGKGGQNVNKVSSKVEVIFHIASAPFLTFPEKELLHVRLANRIDQAGNLHVVCQEDRSQLMNKEKAMDKLLDLLEAALHLAKKRKPTRVPVSLILKRKSDKQSLSSKKEGRRRPLTNFD